MGHPPPATREALLLLGIGIAVGLPLSWAAARLLSDQLFGLETTELLIYALALIVIGSVVVFSAWLPARRAAATNPVDALRYE